MFGIYFLLLVYTCLYDLFINSGLSLPINRYLFNFKDISIFPKHIFITCSTPSPFALPRAVKNFNVAQHLSQFCKDNGLPRFAAPHWADSTTFSMMLPAGTDLMQMIKKMIDFHMVYEKENRDPNEGESVTMLKATVMIKAMKSGQTAHFLGIYYKHPYKDQIDDLTFLFKTTKDDPSIEVLVGKNFVMNMLDTQYIRNLYILAYKIPRDKKFTKMRNPGPLRRQLMNVPHYSETDLPKSILKMGTSSDNDLKFEELWFKVYFPKNKLDYKEKTWDDLVDCDDKKNLVKATMLLSLNAPTAFGESLTQTMAAENIEYPPHRLKAILFHGPPGTGKTTLAKIIADEISKPMIHLSRHNYFQYSKKIKKLIRKVFKDAKKLASKYGGCIIFFDDIDLLAASSDNGSTQLEAILSFLSDRINEVNTWTDKIMLIGATDKPQNLSKAFLDRVYLKIDFHLPTHDARIGILQRYADHLTNRQVASIADITEGFSGGRIEELCRSAWRIWCRQYYKKFANLPFDSKSFNIPPPPIEIYLQAAREEASS